jgi:hypothetical protein
VLDEYSASQHAPVVTIDAPEPVDPAMISWTATDQDGDELEYIVLYSPDGGTSWYPFAVRVGTTELEIYCSYFAGGENAMVRVLATDGFNMSVADSVPFQVTGKAPIAFIRMPEDNTFFDSAEDIRLVGGAEDMEDGKISESNLTWVSDFNEVLGNGSKILLPGGTLPLGEHIITLFAVDSDGESDTNSVTIYISIPVDIDIKPGSCPNPLNLKSKGVLPVAILGSEDLDVSTIDVDTIRLEGVAPLRSRLEDVATPVVDGNDPEVQHTGDCRSG